MGVDKYKDETIELSWLQRVTFSYMSSIVGKSKSGGKVDASELTMPSDHKCQAAYTEFDANWAEEVKTASSGKKPSLIRAIYKTYRWTFIKAGIFKALWSVFVITGAFYFIRTLQQHVRKEEPYVEVWKGWVLTAFFFVDAWLLGLSMQRMTFNNLTMGTKTRASLIAEVCNRCFRCHTINKEEASKVVSFVSSDVSKVFDGIMEFHYLWTAPFEAMSILALLASLTKQWMTPAIGVIGLVVPLQYIIGFKIIKYKLENAKNVQERNSMFQEILPAIKLVKYYTWERFFIKEIAEVRKRERKIQFWICLMKVINISWVFLVPPLTAFVIFVTYEFQEGRIASVVAFTTLSLFNILRFPLVVLPKAIRAISEAYASVTTLEQYLLKEQDHGSGISNHRSSTIGVSIQNGRFQYGDKSSFQLVVPDFSVRAGEVVAVVGRVASGKSSLINAILGNTTKLQGSIQVGGTIGYVPQAWWCQNLTIRDGILFGNPMNQRRYDDIIDACALTLDLEILPAGDMSYAGLRGINLSGGQRQRLNLARCAYSDAQLMLLDNALSAVDHHTAQHIFEKCIKGLFADKAVILITHQLEFLSRCDKVAIMDEGRMTYFGPWNPHAKDLLGKLLPVEHLLHASGAAEERKEKKKDDDKDLRKADTSGLNLAPTVIKPDEAGQKKLDSSVAGSVLGIHSILVFIRNGGIILAFIQLGFFLLAQTSRQMSDFWIRNWTSDAFKYYEKNGGDSDYKASLIYTLTYFSLGTFAFWLFMFCRGSTFFWWACRTSQSIHTKAVYKVMNAPMLFFLNTPVGDLLVNFSKDQDVLDENLPDAMHFLGIYGLILLATCITVTITINEFAGIFGGLILVSSIMLHLYLPAATALKKVKADSAGSVVTLVAEVLEGLNVIHAFGKQEYFVQEAYRRVDLANRANYGAESLNLWLAFFCDFFGAALILAVASFATGMATKLGAATVGLAFSNTIQMLVFYTWVIRFLAESISLWGSVEKLGWLATHTPVDGDNDNMKKLSKGDDSDDDDIEIVKGDATGSEMVVVHVDHHKGGKGKQQMQWPSQGRVIFENVWMQYKPNAPFALKGVTFDLAPQMKVGVVGRTGSGKSTLLLALYRMFELGKGRIIVDGVDISTLTLRRLRSGLSIIPQEPVMFSGTVRSNLDPFNEFSDAELWAVIDKVGLKEQVAHQAGGLDGRVDGTGGNAWSLGQQQLVCLARAALRKVPVLCLDEATAAMDPHTEKIVQETIKRTFPDRTTLTIAHRLDTVIESDRVIVMEQGVLKEMDHPKSLLDNPESMFSKLVDKSGAAAAASLRAMAAAHFSNMRY